VSCTEFQVTIENAFLFYSHWLEAQPVSSHTKRVYESRMKQFVRFCHGLPTGECDNAEAPKMLDRAIVHYKQFLKDSLKVKSSSINSNLIAINNFCRFLGLELTIERETFPSPIPRVMTEDETHAFLDALERRNSSRDTALVFLFLHAALKIGKCSALNVEDVKEMAGEVVLRINEHSSRRTDGACYKPKLISLDQNTSKAVLAWLTEREKKFLHPGPALFVNARAQRISTSGIDYLVKKIGWDARLSVSAEFLRRSGIAHRQTRPHEIVLTTHAVAIGA